MNFDPHFKSLQDGRTDINIQYELLDDGKTLRRSHHNGDKMTALHLLSVMAVDSGLVVYQSHSADKKNEIKSIQESLELFDVKDSCVTLDAMPERDGAHIKKTAG